MFGPWALDSDRRLLTRDDVPVSLSPKAFDLLTLLVQHDEKAFSKSEIHKHLWPDSFVSDGSLTILIAEIRDVLDDDADEPKYVRTVRRFGYAFCAPVVKAGSAPISTTPHVSGWLIWGDRTIALGEGETRLGRATDADVRFDIPGVSRRHARIIIDGVNASLEDLGSQNGTYLRRQRLHRRVSLSDGDEIHLGPVSIVFRSVSPDTSTANQPSPFSTTVRQQPEWAIDAPMSMPETSNAVSIRLPRRWSFATASRTRGLATPGSSSHSDPTTCFTCR